MKNHINIEPSAAREPHTQIRQNLLDLLSGRPELAAQFAHFQAAFVDQNLLPERLLEICRLRVDALHRLSETMTTQLGSDAANRVRGGDYSELSVTEIAALNLAEQLTVDAHGVSSEQVAELGLALGEPGAVTLLTAIALFDSNARMQRVLQPLRDQRHAANS